ncbi:MAG: hypothetical protein HYW90_03675 [Candidatus Sungbacteria bacterium]|nr:hypothetical protein [Candidatus Sungbacteria bacterium]
MFGRKKLPFEEAAEEAQAVRHVAEQKAHVEGRSRPLGEDYEKAFQFVDTMRRFSPEAAKALIEFTNLTKELKDKIGADAYTKLMRHIEREYNSLAEKFKVELEDMEERERTEKLESMPETLWHQLNSNREVQGLLDKDGDLAKHIKLILNANSKILQIVLFEALSGFSK